MISSHVMSLISSPPPLKTTNAQVYSLINNLKRKVKVPTNNFLRRYSRGGAEIMACKEKKLLKLLQQAIPTFITHKPMGH